MSDHENPRIDTIARRLERAARVEPPPALRDRVLLAVDDVLAAPRPMARAAAADTLPAWPWAAAAVAVGFAIAAPFLAAVTDPATLRRPGPSALVARLRASGLDDEPFLATLAATPRRDAAIAPVHPDPVPAARPGLRRIDLKRLLEEDLRWAN
jgi:hypothetical protein